MYLCVVAWHLLLVLLNIEAANIVLDEGKGDPVSYTILRQLGFGQHGVVFEAYYMDKERQIGVAVKIPRNAAGVEDIQNAFAIHTHLGAVNSPDTDPEKLRKAIEAGVSTVRNTGKVISSDLKEFNFSENITQQIALVIDLYGEELFEVIVDKKTLKRKQVDNATFFNITEQMLLPISFLHENDVIHGDIKLENYVYLRDRSRLVLIDLGGARRVSDPFTTITGSLYYFSLRTVILQIEKFKYLPDKYTPLNQVMDMDDDLESYAVSVYHIKVDANWTGNAALFLEYYEALLKLQEVNRIPEKQRKQEKDAVYQTLTSNQKVFWNIPASQRNKMQTELFEVRDWKMKFPEDIAAAIQKANLPAEMGEILKHLLLFARRSLPGYEKDTSTIWPTIQQVESETLKKLKSVTGYNSSASLWPKCDEEVAILC